MVPAGPVRTLCSEIGKRHTKPAIPQLYGAALTALQQPGQAKKLAQIIAKGTARGW